MVVSYSLQALHIALDSTRQILVHPARGKATSKVNQICIVVPINKNVIRLCVPPDNVLGMEFAERIAYLL